MDMSLMQYGDSLEDAFFRKRDAELIAQQCKLAKMKHSRQKMAEVSGVTDAKVLDKFIELDLSPEILSCLAVVPLVEVAWADGKVDANEVQEVLAGAVQAGIKEDSVDYALLKAWLKQRPPAQLLEAWMHYVTALCQQMDPKERRAFEKDIIGRARSVAEASGGLLGVAFKVSPAEQAVLDRMDSAFK